MVAAILDTFFTQTGMTPVLLDIGCSGDALPVWQPMRGHAHLVGYDPDDREVDAAFGDGFREASLMRAAVCDNDQDETMRIVLTSNPYCSSHLYPNRSMLEHYSILDLFDVLEEVQVPATSLNRTLRDLRLNQIDWIKVDAQGCDMRILQNLNQGALDQLLAVDTEPGFHEYYVTEDQFHQIHQFLIDNEFWLAQLEYQRYARTRPDTVRYIAELLGAGSPQEVVPRLGKSPTAAEARYLRTIEHILSLEPKTRERGLLLTFAFSILIGLRGFGADVMLAYSEVVGPGPNLDLMQQALLTSLREAPLEH